MNARDGLLGAINGLSMEDKESLIVKTFVSINGVEETLFANNPEFAEVYNRVDEREHNLGDYSSQDTESMSKEMNLQDVEALFEEVIHPKKKKEEGVVYTPDYIVNYLLSEALSMVPKKPDEVSICDPACGSGGFLVGAVEILCEQGIDPIKAINEQIVGFDIDNNAVKFAKSHLYLYLLLNGHSIEGVSPRVYRKDTLLTTPEELWKTADRQIGFDIIGTNPPYVKLQNLPSEYRPRVLEAYSDYATGSYSMAMLFFIACHRMINSEGVVAVITQNNFFTSKAATKTREYAQEKKCIRRVVDFSNHLIFKGVLAYTCLLFLDANERKTHFEYRDLYKHGVGPNLLPTSDFSLIPYSELKSKKWRLAEDPHRLNILKIEKTGIQLGELCDIKVGFATLRDKIFFALKKDKHWYCKDADGVNVQVEKGVIVPAVKIADFSSEAELRKNNRGLIFPYSEVGGELNIIEESTFKRTAPLAFAHLESFKEELAKRDKGNKQYEAWYAWGRTQGRQAPGPKLLTKTFDAKPSFKLDRTNSLFCNGYAVMPPNEFENSVKLSIKGLKKIINSRFMHYYTKATSFQIDGDYQCYQKNFIELFGIPILGQEECKEIEKGSVAEIEEILSKKYDIPLKHIDEYFDY